MLYYFRMPQQLEYRSWYGARRRCYCPWDPSYTHYGGRGIRMCEAWQNDFAAFYAYIGPKPTPLHTIDRINNDGHYEPGNVRWATRSEQNRNRRPSVPRIDLTGKTFNRWTALTPVPGPYGRWLCRCRCGTEGVVRSERLRDGTALSCGCILHEKLQRRPSGRWYHPI